MQSSRSSKANLTLKTLIPNHQPAVGHYDTLFTEPTPFPKPTVTKTKPLRLQREVDMGVWKQHLPSHIGMPKGTKLGFFIDSAASVNMYIAFFVHHYYYR